MVFVRDLIKVDKVYLSLVVSLSTETTYKCANVLSYPHLILTVNELYVILYVGVYLTRK